MIAFHQPKNQKASPNQLHKRQTPNPQQSDQSKQAAKTLNSVSNLVEKFLFYCEYEKNASPKTIENYSLRLNRLISYIGDVDVHEIKPMHILDFRMHLTST
jgi:hypothetical protein